MADGENLLDQSEADQLAALKMQIGASKKDQENKKLKKSIRRLERIAWKKQT